MNFRQKDIGLEKYETGELFMSLFYPTLLVIVTVIQLQVFHKNYLETLKIPKVIQSNVSGNHPPSSICYDHLTSEFSEAEQHEDKNHYNICGAKVSECKSIGTIQTFQNISRSIFNYSIQAICCASQNVHEIIVQTNTKN